MAQGGQGEGQGQAGRGRAVDAGPRRRAARAAGSRGRQLPGAAAPVPRGPRSAGPGPAARARVPGQGRRAAGTVRPRRSPTARRRCANCWRSCRTACPARPARPRARRCARPSATWARPATTCAAATPPARSTARPRRSTTCARACARWREDMRQAEGGTRGADRPGRGRGDCRTGATIRSAGRSARRARRAPNEHMLPDARRRGARARAARRDPPPLGRAGATAARTRLPAPPARPVLSAGAGKPGRRRRRRDEPGARRSQNRKNCDGYDATNPASKATASTSPSAPWVSYRTDVDPPAELLVADAGGLQPQPAEERHRPGGVGVAGQRPDMDRRQPAERRAPLGDALAGARRGHRLEVRRGRASGSGSRSAPAEP